MKCLSTKLATAGVCAVQIKYEDKASLFLCTIRLQFLHRLDFSSSNSRYKEVLVAGAWVGTGGWHGWGQHYGSVCVQGEVGGG